MKGLGVKILPDSRESRDRTGIDERIPIAETGLPKTLLSPCRNALKEDKRIADHRSEKGRGVYKISSDLGQKEKKT